MLRSSWDLVSPSSWLDSLTGDESLLSGLGTDFPSATIVIIPVSERDEDEAAALAVSGTAAGTSAVRESLADDEFFADLPTGTRALATHMPASLAPPQGQPTKLGYSFSTYSYSRCATLNDNLDLVSSTRRRYEDSSGCLKAVHKRQIGARKLESMWLKSSDPDVEDRHTVHVSPGDTKNQFDKDWQATPFGQAHAQGQAHKTALPDATPASEIP